jgi:hypothetical protein
LSARLLKVGSVVTLLAVAGAAYLVADAAHEGLGHGGACLALGGKLIAFSTTFEDCSIRSRLIDGAGPLIGIVVALLAWLWLRFAPPRAAPQRAFLCLVFAFAVFWNVGYMVKSGLTDQGDWAFVIGGLRPGAVWHAGLTILGIVLYAIAMRMLGAVIRRTLATGTSGITPFGFALTALLAAGALSAAAAVFDPRGASTILTDALPSSLGSFGLVWVGWIIGKRSADLRIAVPASPAWITVGLGSAIFLVAVLGPGLRF